jgi:ABC-type lipopolysaccharide export system ATPase subunit
MIGQADMLSHVLSSIDWNNAVLSVCRGINTSLERLEILKLVINNGAAKDVTFNYNHGMIDACNL